MNYSAMNAVRRAFTRPSCWSRVSTLPCFSWQQQVGAAAYSSSAPAAAAAAAPKQSTTVSDLMKADFDVNVDPLKHEDYFGVKNFTSVNELFGARVHFGHNKTMRNESMKPYLFGCRMNTDVIDLDKTLVHMKLALNFIAHMSYRHAVILFIMQSSQFGHEIEKVAEECGQYSHTRIWKKGMFTAAQENTKQRYPDVAIFLSTSIGSLGQHPAVNECAKMGIATVGVCDSNVDPSIITYPVPGNDDTRESIDIYLDLFKRAIKAGAERRQQDDLRLAELKAEEKALLKEKGVVEEEEEDSTSAFSRIAS